MTHYSSSANDDSRRERRLIDAAYQELNGSSEDWTNSNNRANRGILTKSFDQSRKTETSSLQKDHSVHGFVIGDHIGPYVLRDFLGRGAYGEVWCASRESSIVRNLLAIKLLTDSGTDLEQVRQEAEAWIHAGQHPNVLPLFEADIYDGQLVFASEFVPGGSLDRWNRSRDGKSSLQDKIEITAGILCGLEHLHVRGILHRDLKPANILMQGEYPRIADFGLARYRNRELDSSTLVGTPLYMAPECFGGEFSVQTDIWSIGIMLYQLLCGSPPYYGKSIAELVKRITQEPVPCLPRESNDLQEIVNCALAKSPANRFHSAAEMRSALKNVLRRMESVDPQLQKIPRRGPRTVAITGTMNAEPRRCVARLLALAEPLLGDETTWYCGTSGAVDEAALQYLVESNQRVTLVGYHAMDLSGTVNTLMKNFSVPFVDANSESVPADPDAPSKRDIYFATKADLVIVIWDGKSKGTERLVNWLRLQHKDHILAFI